MVGNQQSEPGRKKNEKLILAEGQKKHKLKANNNAENNLLASFLGSCKKKKTVELSKHCFYKKILKTKRWKCKLSL